MPLWDNSALIVQSRFAKVISTLHVTVQYCFGPVSDKCLVDLWILIVLKSLKKFWISEVKFDAYAKVLEKQGEICKSFGKVGWDLG